eukprot:1961384-Pleurochrysis_carterae.AAC.1
MPRQPALARSDEVLREPAPLPSPLAFAYGLTPTVAPSFACEHLPQFEEHDLPAVVTQHACTRSLTASLRRFKRSETTRTQSRKTRRHGVGIGCHSPSFW